MGGLNCADTRQIVVCFLSDGSLTTAGVGDGMYICHVNDRHRALTAGNRVVI